MSIEQRLLLDDVEKLLNLELLIRLSFVDDFDLFVCHTVTGVSLLVLVARRAGLLAMLGYTMTEDSTSLTDVCGVAVLVTALYLVDYHRPVFNPSYVVFEREIF